MATWEQNKDFIVSQVQAGKATPGQIDWYNRWVASGSPESQAGMVAGVQTGPQIGFGDSYIDSGTSSGGSNAQNRFNQLKQTTQEATANDGTTEQQTPEDIVLNENFLRLLQQLGFANLLQGFQQQTAPQQLPALVPQGMLNTGTFGVAPVRQGYLPPMVVPQSSIAADTGLLQYILNQG